MNRTPAKRTRWLGSTLLLTAVAGAAGGLTVWKQAALARAAAVTEPEPAETVTAVVAAEREHRRTVTSVGTALALRSVTLRNELAGTVRHVALTPGQIVEEGAPLVALDVSVEQAELRANQARATLADSVVRRVESLLPSKAVSAEEVDRARAERDVAVAQVERVKAVIAQKSIRAPFRARVGLSDVHVGQYLQEGTLLTTLQGVDDAVHVDFAVAQRVAAGLRVGDAVELSAGADAGPLPAKVVAVDARVDAATRNATVRARIADAPNAPSPGASVRVRVPVGGPAKAVAVPASALRKGPGGDHVFVIAPGQDGQTRVRLRRVQAGPPLGDDVLIHSGLAAGETVAATGSFKLRDNALVVVATAPAAAANTQSTK